MRIISGELKGRTLRTPPGRHLRPTQGHVRQVLFDVVGEGIAGARILDIFAGVGAIGIEALSRGAAEAVFVERDLTALRFLRMNLDVMGLLGRVRILPVSVESAARILGQEREPFRWIFADPPYRLDSSTWVSRMTDDGPGAILDPEGTLVIETSVHNLPAEEIAGLKRFRDHAVGETHLEFYGWDGRHDGEKRDIPGDV
jgi:16S rRNA (guanine966-N2)-methyltransferase